MFPAGLPIKSRCWDKPAAAGKLDKWFAYNPTQAEETEACSRLDCLSRSDAGASASLWASPTSGSPTIPPRLRRLGYAAHGNQF